MNVANIRLSLLASHTARDITLLVFIAILVGNFLFELGELLSKRLQIDEHFCNQLLLTIGLAGVAGFGFTLFCRRNNCDNTPMDKLKG